MSTYDIGANRHVWETRFAELEDELALEPVAALGDLVDLVEEMLDATGYEADASARPGPADPEVRAGLDRARELVNAHERGDAVRHDDAQQAAAELRDLLRALLEHPEAEAADDLLG